MKESEFGEQVKLLQTHFGEKQFNPAFCKFLWEEVGAMPAQSFSQLVRVMVENRKANNPPVLTDFREQRLTLEKKSFEREVYQATKAVGHLAKPKDLNEILKGEFGAVDSVMDAFQVALHKQRIAKANAEPGDLNEINSQLESAERTSAGLNAPSLPAPEKEIHAQLVNNFKERLDAEDQKAIEDLGKSPEVKTRLPYADDSTDDEPSSDSEPDWDLFGEPDKGLGA